MQPAASLRDRSPTLGKTLTSPAAFEMPIFTRRRLQAMLNDLAPRFDRARGNDLHLLRRLENKRVDQALPAEMELALLWGLLQLGDVEVDPEWFAIDSQPDGYSEMLFPPHPAVVEIAAISDAGLAQEEKMSRTAQLLCEAANQFRRGEGRHLYFRFGETRRDTPDGYVRLRKVDPNFTVTAEVAANLRTWITSGGSMARRAPLRIVSGMTDVVVTWHEHKWPPNCNFWLRRIRRRGTRPLDKGTQNPSGPCRVDGILGGLPLALPRGPDHRLRL
jgi:hypothetical protein